MRRSGEARFAGAALAIIAFGFLLGVFVKGPSLDEYWTIFYTDPAVPLAQAWYWWSADSGHPVGFYALNRLYASLLPQSVTLGRLLNLIPLAIFLWLAFLRGERASNGYGKMFAVVLLGSYAAIERFAEFRAFFTGFMLLAILVLVLERGLAERAGARAMGWRVGLLACCLALFNYTQFAAAIALLAATAVVLTLSQRRQEAAALALGASVGIAVAVVSIWNAVRVGLLEPAYEVGFASFAVNLAAVGGTAVLANLAASYLALRGGLKVARSGLQARPARDWGDEERFAVCLLLAIVFAFVGYATLNFASHSMVKRQLIGVVPLIAAFIASLALRSRLAGREFVLVLLALAASLTMNLGLLRAEPKFDRYGARLASAQKKCPAFAIFAVPPDPLIGPLATMNAEHRNVALAKGYRDVAHRFGFRLQRDDAPRRFDPECGGTVWVEHAWLDPGGGGTGPSLAADLGFTLTPRQRASASFEHFDSALLICVPGETAGCGSDEH